MQAPSTSDGFSGAGFSGAGFSGAGLSAIDAPKELAGSSGLLIVADRWHRGGYRSRKREGARPIAAPQLEGSARHRRRVRRVADLSRDFQEQLDAEQKRLWLLLEEALLEHHRLSCQEYFEAGARRGRRAAYQERAARGEASRRSEPSARERQLLELVRAVVRVLRE